MRHYAPPATVNLVTYLHSLEICDPLYPITSLHATIRSVIHQLLSGFATHLPKCVHEMNMSSKAQLNRYMRLTPSVRRPNGLRLLGQVLCFGRHRPDKVGVVESSGVLGERLVPSELHPAAHPLEIGPGSARARPGAIRAVLPSRHLCRHNIRRRSRSLSPGECENVAGLREVVFHMTLSADRHLHVVLRGVHKAAATAATAPVGITTAMHTAVGVAFLIAVHRPLSRPLSTASTCPDLLMSTDPLPCRTRQCHMR